MSSTFRLLGSTSSGTFIDPPPDTAQAFGATALGFWDHFTSSSTIDLANSGAAGFKWYLTDGVQAGPSNASDLSVSNSVLHINGNTALAHIQLSTAVCNKTAHTFNGNAFSGGGYFSAKMAFAKAQATSTSDGWPAFWSVALNSRIFDGDVSLTRYIEPDFFEAFPTGVGTISPTMDMHDWDVATSQNRGLSNSVVTLPGTPSLTLSDFHVYGTLIVPTTKNSGIGLVKRYFDGQHIASADVSFTTNTDSSPVSSGGPNPSANGVFSIFDSQSVFINLGAGNLAANALYVDYVSVWPLP